MFKILEIVQGKNDELIERYLPLQFPTQAEARAHVEMLQAQFLLKGYDEDADSWWARSAEKGDIYHWTIGAVAD